MKRRVGAELDMKGSVCLLMHFGLGQLSEMLDKRNSPWSLQGCIELSDLEIHKLSLNRLVERIQMESPV